MFFSERDQERAHWRDNVVCILIDNGKLANQIVRLVATVVKYTFLVNRSYW